MEHVWYLIAKEVGTLRKQHVLLRDISTCLIARETQDPLFSTFMQLKFNLLSLYLLLISFDSFDLYLSFLLVPTVT